MSRSILVFIVTLAACGPRVSPPGPGIEPEPAPAPASAQREVPTRPPAQEVLIGEMCPRAAAGRPAVKPLFLRGLGWSSALEELTAPVERRSARQFQVLAWDGRRAGIFSVAGLADVGPEQEVAAGAYAGVSPCTQPAQTAGGTPREQSTCVSAQSHCGVAVAILETGGPTGMPFEEDPEPRDLPVAGACVSDGKLLVDIDDDGATEAFPVEQFVGPVRAPSQEVLAVDAGAAQCRPTFSIRHAVPPGDPKHWRGLDVLGVIDVDGDGRRELIMAYHYANRRTWAVYSAIGSSARLDLVGETEPWSAR